MARLPALVWTLALAALLAVSPRTAGADEPGDPGPVLPTRTMSELLGAAPIPGMTSVPIQDLGLWDGTLDELRRAVAELGGPAVAFDHEVNGSIAVTLAAQVPVTAERAAEALVLAAERAGYTVARQGQPGEAWRVQRPPEATLATAVYVLIQPHSPGTAELTSMLFGTDGGEVMVRDVEVLEISLMAMTPADMGSFFEGLPEPAERPPPDDRGVREDPPGHYRVPREALADLAEIPFTAATLRPRGGRGGSDEGILLRRVQQHGPLYALGLRDGDAVASWDGSPLVALPDLEGALRALMTAEEVELGVVRDGDPLTLRYELVGSPMEIPPLWGVDDPSPDELRAHHGIVSDGRHAADVPRAFVLAQRNTLARQIRWSYRLDDEGRVTGVMASGRRGDLLTLVGLRPGTTILAVDDVPVTDPPSLMALFTALRTQEQVTLTIAGRQRPEAFVIRVAGDPDPDPEPWPLEVLTVPGTREQLRAHHGVELAEGAHTFPRAAIADLHRSELTFRPAYDGDERLVGYRLIGNRYGELPDLLGIVPGAILLTLDGEPLEGEGDVYALFEAWLTATEVQLTLETRAGTPVALHHHIVGEPAPLPDTWLGTGVDVEPDLRQRRAERGIQGGHGEFEVPEGVVTSLQRELSLARRVRDPDGSVRYSLTRVSNRTAWFAIGLRTGDLIVGCNGAPLTVDADLGAALETLRTGEPLVLDVVRGDEPLAVLLVLALEG